jgi:phosphoribosyl-dephospho-CoA transferase
MTLRPHDLVRLTDPAVLVRDAPGWVPAALARTPWVVVRRSTPPTGCVSVGVRGDTRAQRHPLTVPQSSVREVLAPEDLAHLDLTGCRDLPALCALAEVRAHLDDCAMPWGPTGSVGFELATGAATVGPDSDVDLVVRAPLLTSALRQRLTALHGQLQGLDARVDCQVETARGAVALAELAELATSGSEVLVRSGTGPGLVPIGKLLA